MTCELVIPPATGRRKPIVRWRLEPVEPQPVPSDLRVPDDDFLVAPPPYFPDGTRAVCHVKVTYQPAGDLGPKWSIGPCDPSLNIQ